jgi:hypothetical protein
MSSYGVEEVTYFLLKKNYDCYGSYTDQLVQYATEQLHIKNLTDEYPDTDKNQHSIEYMHGA